MYSIHMRKRYEYTVHTATNITCFRQQFYNFTQMKFNPDGIEIDRITIELETEEDLQFFLRLVENLHNIEGACTYCGKVNCVSAAYRRKLRKDLKRYIKKRKCNTDSIPEEISTSN